MPRLGMNAEISYKTTPLTGSEPNDVGTGWVPIGNAKDVTLNLETGKADTTRRANNGWRSSMATLKNGTVEFTMGMDDDDAAIELIRDTWLEAGSEIAVAVMDRPITETGAQGLVGNFAVTNFSRSEPLEEEVTYNVTLEPSSHMQWFEKGPA